MSRSRNLAVVRMSFWFAVARVFRRGEFLPAHGKTLASKKASYKFFAPGSMALAGIRDCTGAVQ